MKVKVNDVEERLVELFENNDIERFVVEEDADNMMVVDAIVVRISKLGLDVRTGTAYIKDDDGEWMADWDATVIYSEGADVTEYLSYEQDSIPVALHNYLVAEGEGREKELDNLTVQIILNE